MSKTIIPHKGGRTKQLRARCTPQTHRAIMKLCKQRGISVADWIEEKLHEEQQHKKKQT